MSGVLFLAGRLAFALTAVFLVTSHCQTCTWRNAAVPVSSVECRHTSSLLAVRYDTAVTCDEDLSGKNLTDAPSVSWAGAHSSETYLLIEIDPDASTPCQPDLRYVLHWAAFVRGGPSLRVTQEFISYRSPHPPVGTPPHRYQFLLYRWVPEIGDLRPSFLGNNETSRFHFDFDRFKVVNQLEHLEAYFEYQYSR